MTDLKFKSPSGETTIKVQDTGRLGTVAPKIQLHIRKMDEPVKYETPMTENKEEIEKVKAQIKVLQKKLDFLEELERTKTPCEEAYKRVYGFYPETYEDSWSAFQDGYIAAQKDYKVGEYQETAQERGERVHKEMEETIKIHDGYGVVSSSTKPQTLSDLIYDWWERVFGDTDDTETCIDHLVDEISLWLPTEHDTNSYKWNECIRMIREKLR